MLEMTVLKVMRKSLFNTAKNSKHQNEIVFLDLKNLGGRKETGFLQIFCGQQKISYDPSKQSF